MADLGRKATYDPLYHPNKLIEFMEQGMLDVEVFAEFEISKTTFYRWLREYPEFKDAYEIGLPKCEKKTMIEPLKRMVAEKDERGYKALAHLGRNKFGHDVHSSGTANTNNTLININNLNMLSSKADYDLLEMQVKEQLEDLNIIEGFAIKHNKDLHSEE